MSLNYAEYTLDVTFLNKRIEAAFERNDVHEAYELSVELVTLTKSLKEFARDSAIRAAEQAKKAEAA